jgi:hypothetical protein
MEGPTQTGESLLADLETAGLGSIEPLDRRYHRSLTIGKVSLTDQGIQLPDGPFGQLKSDRLPRRWPRHDRHFL